MNTIKLQIPLEYVSIIQPFGVNYADFYKQLGLLGHNGIDFRAFDGCNVYASHDGIIMQAGDDGTGGIIVVIWDKNGGYKTLYYHLKSVIVKQGDEVKRGDIIAISDNTGKMTTGSHLHHALKLCDINGNTLNLNNGYYGCIDQSPYFVYNGNGEDMKNSDWDKSRCYHRYYRGRPKGGLINEAKILAILSKKGIWVTTEKINALVYGGWDLEAVKNPAMYENFSQLKKDEFYKGFLPFRNNDKII